MGMAIGLELLMEIYPFPVTRDALVQVGPIPDMILIVVYCSHSLITIFILSII